MPNLTFNHFTFIQWKYWIVISLILTHIACNGSRESKAKKRWLVMTTELVNDEGIIMIYDSLHAKNNVWPALKKANQASGIEEIKIYRYGNRLTMMVMISEDTDLKKMDSLYVAADERVKEWGKMMNNFQRSLPGVDSTQKWVEMKLIHHYEDGEYLQ
jgi:L-rhamnose mutarotase